MMIDFFGTTPGLLSLAGLALILILVSVLKRLMARARARRAQGAASTAAAGLASASPAQLPRWVVAAIAAWAAEEAGGGPAGGVPASRGSTAPSAASWRPTAGASDPWTAAAGPERRNVGVTK
jgi:hypothetical protein